MTSVAIEIRRTPVVVMVTRQTQPGLEEETDAVFMPLVSKGLFTPNKSEKDQKINGKHQRNFMLSHSLSFGLKTA